MKRILSVIIMLFFSVLAFGQLRISQIEPIKGEYIKSPGEAASKVLTTNGSGGASWQIPATWQTPLNGTGYVKMTGTIPSYDNTVVTSPLGFSSDYFIPMTLYGRELQMSPMAVVDNVFYPGVKTHLLGYDLKINTISSYSGHLTSNLGSGAGISDNLYYDPDFGGYMQDDPAYTSAMLNVRRSIPLELFTTTAGSTTPVRLLRVTTNGNLLLNQFSDNGIDKLQVTGSGLFTGDLNVNGGDIFTTGTDFKISTTDGTFGLSQGIRVLRYNTTWTDNKRGLLFQLGRVGVNDTVMFTGANGVVMNRLGFSVSGGVVFANQAYTTMNTPTSYFNVHGTSYLNGAVTSTGTIQSTNTNGWAIGALAGAARIQYVAAAGPGNLGQFTALHATDGYANIRGATFESTATGISPFVVASTGLVTNLNADLLDGQHGSYYSPTTHTHQFLTSPVISGTDLNTLGSTYGLSYSTATAAAPNIFPAANNANAVLTISQYSDANYMMQLGFSGDGKLYTRRKIAGTWDSNPTWKTVAYSNVNANFSASQSIDIGASATYPLTLTSSGIATSIGSLNSSYFHLNTAATSGFYFYQPITSAGSISGTAFRIGVNDINTAGTLDHVAYKGTLTNSYLPYYDGIDLENSPLYRMNSGAVTIGGSTIYTSSGSYPVYWSNSTQASNGYSGFGGAQFTNDLYSTALMFVKSRGTTVGTHGAVISGDRLGTMFFEGSDGITFKRSAQELIEVDGTVSTNIVPSRFTWYTTNSTGTMQEKMRLTAAGNVGINNLNPVTKLDVIATTGTSDYPTLATAGIVVRDDSPVAANTGGTIMFTSKYGSSYLSGAPYIRAYKENATADDYQFGLKFGTRGPAAQQLSMTLTPNGTLKIGNVAAGLEALLQVNGNITGAAAEETYQMPTWGQVGSSIQSAINGAVFGASGVTNYVAKYTGLNTIAYSQIFDNGTNVGLQTTAPEVILQIGTELNPIGAGDNKSVNFGIVSRYSTGTVKQYNVMGYYATTVDASDIFLQTGGETAKNFFTGIVSDAGYFNSDRFSIIGNGNERLSVLQNGNVGIGNTAPGDKLHVSGTVTHSDATLDTQSATLGQVKTQVATVRNPYFIAGTGSIAGTWIGAEASITSYYNGLTIWYQIPVAGAATTTLNLNSLGAKTIYRSAANKLTTHYAVNAIVMLVYSTALNGGCFMTEGSDYDSDSYDKMYWGVNVIAGAAIYDYKIMMQGTNGKFYPLTLEEGSAATKTVSTQSFLLNTPILYYGTTTNIAADAAFTYNFSEINTTSLNQTANISSWTAYQPMYLKGTIQADGTFKLDNTSYTSWLTQTLPATDDGFVYIRLGYAYATGGFRLETDHPIYHYKNGKVTIYDSSSGSYLPLAGGTLTGDLKITESSPSLTFTSDLTSVLPSGGKEIEIPFIGWDGWTLADTVYNIAIVSEPNGVFSPGAKVFELQGVSDAGKNSQMLRIAHNNGMINPMFKFKGNIAAYNKLGFFTDFTGDHVYDEPTTYVNRSGTILQFTDPTNGTVTLTKLKEAYDNHVVSAAFTGSSTKTLTFTTKDLGTFTASFVDDIGSTYSDAYVNGGYFWAPNFTSSGSISFVNTTGQTITANLNTVAGLTPGSYTNANITVGSDGRLTLASSGSSGSSNWTNGTNFSYYTDSGDDIGIGYTSDQGNYKLQVDGAIKASGIINGSVVYSDTWVSGAYGLTGNELVSKPSTPTAGTGQIYIKTDNKPYFQNDSGTEYDLTATGAADGNISNVSILADVMTFTGTGGGFNGTVPGLARENSQNDFTTYNTFAVSRSGSAVYVSNVNGLGTGVLATGGYLGVDANGATYDLELGQSGKIMIQTFAAAPASSSATGTTGTVIVTADYIFVCTATNTWKRVATSTW